MGGHINAASKSSAAAGDRRLARRYALACAANSAVASAYVTALRACRTVEWVYNRHSFCNCRAARHAKHRSPRKTWSQSLPPDVSSERHASSRDFNTLQMRKTFDALQSVALPWPTHSQQLARLLGCARLSGAGGEKVMEGEGQSSKKWARTFLIGTRNSQSEAAVGNRPMPIHLRAE